MRPKSHRLEGGEEVAVDPFPEQVRETPAAPFSIRFEDEHLLVVDKPAGVTVHPGAGHEPGGTLAEALRAHGAAGGEEGREGIVHRLDRDTSGLLVVARSVEAFDALSDLVRARQVVREYTALVRGTPRSRTGRIEAPIGRDRRDPTRRSILTDTPRDAVTHFELLETAGEHALLRVTLETGRTHQIRVHLAAIDLPVVGDPLYGVLGLGLRRQFLHASRLAFAHPFTGQDVEVESALPDDLAEALASARSG